MSTDNMDRSTINQRILHAKTHKLDVVIRYWTGLGTHTVPAKLVGTPLPGSLAFIEWEDGQWQHTFILGTSDIEAIWTEDDDCPNCGDLLVDLDGFYQGWAEPICQVCAREVWESSRAEGLVADGGVL